ncbi:MAG: response regulator transcription factor [Pseudonocardiaceae bacterium]
MKVVIADPSPLLRSVIVGACAEATDIDVAATVELMDELRTSCRRYKPQVVLAGTSFSDGAMLDAIADILHGGTRVLVICDARSADVASALLFAGASGCLFVQDAGPADVVEATRAIAAGNAALHPAVAAAILQLWRSAPALSDREAQDLDAARPPKLTPREAQVLRALARGLPTKAIGRELNVSPKTVEAHIARLLTKLKARTRAHAVSIALDLGLLEGKEV